MTWRGLGPTVTSPFGLVALTFGAVLMSGAALVAAQQQDELGRADAGRMVVLDPDGRGVAGAEVMILRQEGAGASPMAAVLVDTKTAAGGVVQSRVPRLGGLLVVVDHLKHLPFVAAFPDSPPPSSIRLEAGGLVVGEVVERETGSAVPEAQVCASWIEEHAPERFRRWERCALSGEAGRVELPGVPAGDLRVTVSARGYEGLAQTLEETKERIVLALDPTGPVGASPEPEGSGRVLVEVLGADGEPVDSFTMRVEAVSGGRRSGTAVAVEQESLPATASVSARHLKGGTIAVSFEAENHLRSPMIGVQILPGGEVDLGAVFLESGAVVRGRMFDAVGAEPASGCLVELVVSGAGEIRATLLGIRPLTVSGEDGNYLLGGLSEGRYHLRKQCYGSPAVDRLVVLGPSEELDLGEVWLHPGRRVEVFVDGLSDGTVRVLDRFKEIRTPIVEAVLASSGRPARFGEEGVPSAAAELLLVPGDYRFEAHDGGGSLRISQEVTIDAAAAGDAQPVRLSARIRTIRSVLAMDGVPVGGGSVSFAAVLDSGRGAGTIMVNSQAGSATPQRQVFRPGGSSLRAKVDTEGSFEVTGAPADILWMTWFSADGSSVGRLWPEGALAQLDLSGTRLSGVLLDRDGRPVEGWVGLIGDLGREVATAPSRADGRFDLPPAPPGRYLLHGRAGRTGTASPQIDLTSEAPPPQVLRLPDRWTGQIELTLRRPGGSPAAGAWLHVLDAAGDVAGTGLSSERGRFSRDGVPAGDVSLIWNDSSACVGGVRLTVDEGETARSDLTLPTGRLLELRCPAEECAGAPLSFLSVRTESGVEIAGHLSGATGGPLFSDSGTLGLGCVAPDRYELSFWAAGQRWTAEVENAWIGAEEEPVAVQGRPAGL